MQEQVTLELPGAPGAVRFCMGLGRPGHRSGDRAAAAATVGAPRREQQPKKLPGSGSWESVAASNSRQFRTYLSHARPSHAMFSAASGLGQRIRRRFGDEPLPVSNASYSFFRPFLRRREQLSFPLLEHSRQAQRARSPPSR